MKWKQATMIIIDDPYRPEEPDPKLLKKHLREILRKIEYRLGKGTTLVDNDGDPIDPKKYEKVFGELIIE